MKLCFKCNVAKPLGEFYPHPEMKDGYLGKCKECTKNDVRGNYRKTRKKQAAYERERGQRPERKAKALEYQKKRRLDNPEKYYAYVAVANAVKAGKLVKLAGCEKCQHPKVQAHHDDYSQPLKVRWFCRKCHLEEHGKVAYQGETA